MVNFTKNHGGLPKNKASWNGSVHETIEGSILILLYYEYSCVQWIGSSRQIGLLEIMNPMTLAWSVVALLVRKCFSWNFIMYLFLPFKHSCDLVHLPKKKKKCNLPIFNSVHNRSMSHFLRCCQFGLMCFLSASGYNDFKVFFHYVTI